MSRPSSSVLATLTMPSDLRDKVEVFARLHRWSRAAAVRCLLEEGLARYERGEFRPVPMPAPTSADAIAAE